MESLVAAYAEILGTIRFNLEESARIALDRISITGRLTALARGIVAASRASMVAAADSTDTTLTGWSAPADASSPGAAGSPQENALSASK